jgi:hypothetical protein
MLCLFADVLSGLYKRIGNRTHDCLHMGGVGPNDCHSESLSVTIPEST